MKKSTNNIKKSKNDAKALEEGCNLAEHLLVFRLNRECVGECLPSFSLCSTLSHYSVLHAHAHAKNITPQEEKEDGEDGEGEEDGKEGEEKEREEDGASRTFCLAIVAVTSRWW